MTHSFKVFLMLAAAATAGFGDTIITEQHGNLLLFHRVVKTDSIFFDSAVIPVDVAREAYKKNPAVHTVFYYSPNDIFGLTLKITPEKRLISKKGNCLETKAARGKALPNKKFNFYGIISIFLTILASLILSLLKNYNIPKCRRENIIVLLIAWTIVGFLSAFFLSIEIKTYGGLKSLEPLTFLSLWFWYFGAGICLTAILSLSYRYCPRRKIAKK